MTASPAMGSWAVALRSGRVLSGNIRPTRTVRPRSRSENRNGRENRLSRALDLTTRIGNLGWANCVRSISPTQVTASDQVQRGAPPTRVRAEAQKRSACRTDARNRSFVAGVRRHPSTLNRGSSSVGLQAGLSVIGLLSEFSKRNLEKAGKLNRRRSDLLRQISKYTPHGT